MNTQEYINISSCLEEYNKLMKTTELLSQRDIGENYNAELITTIVTDFIRDRVAIIKKFLDIHLTMYYIDITEEPLVRFATNIDPNVIDLALKIYPNMKISVCYWNNSIKDVSQLKGVTKLFLGDCPNITDVSSLTELSYLRLINCKGITDMSMLTKIQDLSWENCGEIYTGGETYHI